MVAGTGYSAAEAVNFINSLDISDHDKEGFRYLVHNSPSFELDVQDSEQEFKTDWSHLYKFHDVDASRQHDEGNSIYRVRGFAKMPCSREVGLCHGAHTQLACSPPLSGSLQALHHE
jgi:hypothetical protein